MKTRTLADSLSALQVFENLPPDDLAFLSECARNVRFERGAFLFSEGGAADAFYVIRKGRVALELEAANRLVTILTVGKSQLVGWSWLVPPYAWHYDARATTPVSAVAFDAVCVRTKCENDPAFGYAMFKHLSQLIVERLMATRVQLMDVYR